MDTLITGIAKIWTDEHGIVHKQVIENTHITVDIVAESFKETLEYIGHEKKLLLYDVRPHFTITDEAMIFLQGKIMEEYSIATAVLANSLGVRIMADYLVHIKNIKVPLQVFPDEQKAIKWLLTFKRVKAQTGI